MERERLRLASVAATFLLAAASLVNLGGSAQAKGRIDPLLVERLKGEAAGQVAVRLHRGTGMVRHIGADPDKPVRNPTMGTSVAPEGTARAFLDTYGPLFGVKNHGRELAVLKEKGSDHGRSFVRFRQRHQDVPVIAGELIVQTDDKGDIVSAHGETIPDLVIDTAPGIEPTPAVNIVDEVMAKFPIVTNYQVVVTRKEYRDEMTVYIELQEAITDKVGLKRKLEKEVLETLKVKGDVIITERGGIPDRAKKIDDRRVWE